MWRIIKDQSGPPENFILAGACLKVSETRCDVSGNSGYYRVEAAVSPHHRHARDAQPSGQPIDQPTGQPIDSIDHGPTIDPTIGSGPTIGEAGARGLGPAGARAGHRPQGPRARHAAAGGDPAPGIIVIIKEGPCYLSTCPARCRRCPRCGPAAPRPQPPGGPAWPPRPAPAAGTPAPRCTNTAPVITMLLLSREFHFKIDTFITWDDR